MSLLKLALSPPAEDEERDTGLRFTDILFGFVIRELFIRLQHWSQLPGFVRWQLIAATALVLGSWIGFRRSVNRPTYQLKFFNLPLLRFFLDQLMLILYFRIATLTPDDPTKKPPDPGALAKHTAYILALVFVLYLLWDLGGIWMGKAGKYPRSPIDWPAVAITSFVLAGVGALWLVLRRVDVGLTGAETAFVIATVLLLAYRFSKEIKTSVRLKPVAA